MKTYEFLGNRITSKLSSDEILTRYDRLKTLVAIYEQFEEGSVGRGICDKAMKAINKKDNWTGIIRLTTAEKNDIDFVYFLDNTPNDFKKAIGYYIQDNLNEYIKEGLDIVEKIV